MRFSIIIPAHNAAQRIPKLLNSIRSQTFKDYEVIVVCDACEDNTAKISEGFNTRIFEVDAHNSAYARNKGLDEAKGEWVMFADDDDWWIHPYALEQIDAELKQEKVPADMLQCSFIFGARGVQPVGQRIWPNVWSKVFRRTAIGNTRFSKNDFPADDLGFVNRMIAKGVTVGFKQMLWYYYDWMRPGSITYGLNNA